ncbi:MAG: hypothetical protein R3Y24_06135 [Eubacteriales bacterium]
MRDNKDATLKRVATVLDNMTKKEMLGWPPNCIGMLFQPERPTGNLFASSKNQLNKHIDV